MSDPMTDTTGAINPYALTEVLLGRRVDWASEPDPQRLVETTLQTPYDQLFDPKHNSPLFAARQYSVRPKPASQPMLQPANPPSPLANGTIGPIVQPTPQPLKRLEWTVILQTLQLSLWQDPGIFFNEAAEFSDPIQGAVGDCFFIAPLASVAWTRPGLIAQRTRATGPMNGQFVDAISFFANGAAQQVEVSERLLMKDNAPVCASSREQGEIWPGVYEKAYARWVAKGTTDTPDIAKIFENGGSTIGALTQLTGSSPFWFGNATLSAGSIFQQISSRCANGKTKVPMVAWTYPTSDAAPDPTINYASAHIVAWHAYSIFGVHTANNQQYIILRNPWGCYEPTLNVDGGAWLAFDGSFWRSTSLPTNDGIFALRADTFQRYFAGFGGVL